MPSEGSLWLRGISGGKTLQTRLLRCTCLFHCKAAHHHTEAGLHAHAVSYWQRAGQRTLERSATLEAVAHLTKGLEVLTTLSDSPERAQQELSMQITLGPALIAAKGYGASDVASAYARASSADRLGDPPALPDPVGPVGVCVFAGRVADRAGAGGTALQAGSTHASSCAPPRSSPGTGADLITWESLPLHARTWSRGCPSMTPSSTALRPSCMGRLTLGSCASPMPPGSCGRWAIRTRPSGGAMRRSPWPRSCPTLQV